MAEFVQMIKDWSRMCLSFKSCGDCPMMDEDGRAHILCSEGGIRSAVPEVQEDVIIKWAAEHPEPVYPTWVEFLKAYETGEPKSDFDFVYWMGTTSIPADIAQKLGIQPKEG